jgi:hypothetical protein
MLLRWAARTFSIKVPTREIAAPFKKIDGKMTCEKREVRRPSTPIPSPPPAPPPLPPTLLSSYPPSRLPSSPLASTLLRARQQSGGLAAGHVRQRPRDAHARRVG